MDLSSRVAEAAIQAIARSSREGLEAVCQLLVELGFSHADMVCLDPDRLACVPAGADAAGPSWVGRELTRSRPAMVALRAGREYRAADFRVIPIFASGGPAGGLVLGIRPGDEPPLPEWAPRLAAALLETRAREQASRRARKAAMAARRQSARVRRELERYLSQARHDLKAPLVPVKGYVDMMLHGMAGPLTPEMERFLERIGVAVERMRELVESRLRTSSEAQVDLRGPIADAIAAQRWLGHTVQWRAPEGACPARVNAAELQLAVRKLLGGILGTSGPRAQLEVCLEHEDHGWGIYLRGDAYASVPVRTARLCRALLARSGAELLTAERGVKVRIPADPPPATLPPPAPPSRRSSSPAAAPPASAADPD
jgi:signal transduction histidine kinase